MSGISRRIAVMSRGFSLAPCGLVIERVESETDKLLLVAPTDIEDGGLSDL